MNLDQQHMYGVTDWRLPSPKSTPKSATFPDASLQTPRTDSLPSHFLEAWSTPRANVQQTPSQTPLFPRSRDRDRPLSSYSHKSQDPEDPGFHINHYSPNPNLQLPPVEPARRLASSPVPLKPRQPPDDNVRASMPTQALTANNMDTSQMQTPPPTRDASSSRKRSQDGRPLSFNTPSTIYSRRDSAPAIPGNHPADGSFGQESGLSSVFPSLQFTPEMRGFGNAGPSTAPGPSRAGIFFNPGTSGEMMHFDSLPAHDDPFGFTVGNAQNMFQWPSFMPTNTSRVDSASMAVSDDVWTQTPSMLTTSADLQSITGSGTATLGDPFVPTTSGVDPSMLFSFSGGASGLDNTWVSPQRPQKAPVPEKRQPYEHQTRESERQKEVARKMSGHHSRTSTASSAAPAATLSKLGGLQRSNTHAGFVRKSALPSENPFGNPSSAAVPPVRKTSPLKRAKQSSLAAISEHAPPRPKTRLIVDESGRARTETVRDGDEEKKPVDHRARYSGLWDDDSDSESDRENCRVSRSTSFSMASGLMRSASKHGRTPSFLTRSHSVKNPQSFSFTDNLSKRLGRLSTESTPKKPKDDSRRSSINSSFGGYLLKEDNAAGEAGLGNNGGAQDALKRVVADAKNKRQETTSAANVRMLEAHNQRWRASADVSKMNLGHGALVDPFFDSSTPSSKATEGSAFTPGTDRSSEAGETRCVCQSTSWDGQLMVQCESCSKWQHARCMGLPPKAELLPSVYVCVFCTGSTPVVRGGRVRDPYRGAHKAASPLAYKQRH